MRARRSPAIEAASRLLCEEEARKYLDIFSRISQSEIQDFLYKQRWFRSKGEKISEVRAPDAAYCLYQKNAYLLLFLRVEYRERAAETYFVPFKVLKGSAAGKEKYAGYECLFRVPDGETEHLFMDAFLHEDFNKWLFMTAASDAEIKTCAGKIVFSPDAKGFKQPRGLEIKKMKAEQSNTSLTAGGKYMLKVLRMSDSEINPEAEMLRYLTARGFRGSPPFRGDAVYELEHGQKSTFSIVVDFVKSESDGWDWLLGTLREYYRRMSSSKAADREAAEKECKIHAEASTRELRNLGKVTAEMHHALALRSADAAFDPEPVTEIDLETWKQSYEALLSRALKAAEALSKKDNSPARQGLESFLAGREALFKKAEELTALKDSGLRKTRYHGDYHLGQVLKSPSGWIVTDFEGEPLRSISERKMKSPPLKDAAGMLRSLSYAAFVSEKEFSEGSPGENDSSLFRDFWYREAREAFLFSYFEAVFALSPELYPSAEDDRSRLLSFFELEKAVYELNYEINNRPAWAGVPLAGIERLLNSGY